MAYLKAISGSNAGNQWEVREPRCVLGRHPDCDIPVDQLDASRHHAQIVAVGSDYFLEDLHSRNGTWLNRDRLTKRRQLSDGDSIRISEMILEFHRGPARSPKKAAPSVRVEDRQAPADVSAAVPCEKSANRDVDRSLALIQAELTALLEIAHALRKSLSLDELLPLVLECVFKIFPAADRGFIVLRAEDGTPIPRWIKIREGNDSQEARLSSAIVERVLDSQQAVLSADAAGDFRFKASESLGALPIRSVMCAPLIDAGGCSMGVLQIDTVDERSQFRENDLHVFAAVATQAAIAFDHARLHEKSLRQREIERDLELADQIQRGFLPAAPPQIAGYRFFDFYRPASYVGGDYYNYAMLPDGRLAIVVADVVGHGLGAAMLTAKFAAEVRCHLLTAASPACAVAGLNRSLAEAIGDGHFITLLLVVLDPTSGCVTVVNAGHPAAILCASGGAAEEIGGKKAGFPLGVFDAAEYEPFIYELPPGGLIVAYTDGITEAMNAQREVYGAERLCRQLQASCGDPVQFGRNIVDDIRRFVGIHPQLDDMCLVCFGRE